MAKGSRTYYVRVGTNDLCGPDGALIARFVEFDDAHRIARLLTLLDEYSIENMNALEDLLSSDES